MSPATPFPPHPPRSLTDPAEIASNDWAAFSQLDRLKDHWARPAWPDGAEAIYWIVNLGAEAALGEFATGYQARLAVDPDLDLVPVESLHLTMHRVPIPVDTAVSQVAEVVDAAAGRVSIRRPLTLTAGPLAGSPGAVRFTITPWQSILDIQSDLAVGHPPRDRRPHVSIAYNSRVRPAAPVIHAVERLHDGRVATVEVTRVDLVRLRRDGRTYRWSTLATVALNH